MKSGQASFKTLLWVIKLTYDDRTGIFGILNSIPFRTYALLFCRTIILAVRGQNVKLVKQKILLKSKKVGKFLLL